MSKQEVLFTLLSAESGECLYYRINNNVVVGHGVGDVDDVMAIPSAAVRCSFLAKQNLFDRIEVAKQLKKETLIERQILRYIQEEAVFNGDVKIFFKSGEVIAEKRQVEFFALQDKELKDIQALVPLYVRPVVSMCQVEHAIAALVKKVTAESVLVLWLRGESAVAMLVSAGEVIAKRFAYIEGSINDPYTKDTIEGLIYSLLTMHQSEHGHTVVKMLTFGELYNKPPIENPNVIYAELLTDKLKSLYKFKGDGGSSDAILTYPEVFGLPFVDSSKSVVTKSYRNEVKSYRLSKPIALVASVFAFFLCAAGVYTKIEADSLQEELVALESRLVDEINQLEAMRPSKQDLDAVANAAELIKRKTDLLNVDAVIAWVTGVFGVDSILSSVKITPDTTGSNENKKNNPGGYRVDVEAYVYTVGVDRESVISRVIWRLSERMEVLESNFEYVEGGKEDKSILSVSMLVKARDFSSVRG